MNTQNRKFFTSESVTGGHPDKLCDQISDAVLDAILAQDPQGRVACECCATTGVVWIMGEISASCCVDIPKIARQVVIDAGYGSPGMGFDGNTCAVLTAIDEQSPDIALGVDKCLEDKASRGKGEAGSPAAGGGAGDQGLMFGYACRETPEFMPLPISLAHALVRQLTRLREDGALPYLRPDGKSQVTVEYDGNDDPVRVDKVVVSTQHAAQVPLEQIRADVLEKVIKPVVPANLLDDETVYYVNPTGRFVVGGPAGDSGLTGRKIIVDTYGGAARHGGGSFSGKDPTKVDRSAAYAARHAAKNIVAAGLAKRCEIQLAYAIGVARPVSVRCDAFGTGVLPDAELGALVAEVFDLRPTAIIRAFDLRRPIYRQLAVLGHVGRTDIDLPWERLDRVEELKKAAGVS
ncbi:MAG: methionine adenosyltransferase [Oscillospiraceae bacterium]|jgi:S-adenosylmethionine synthetase|nr:methionine adenosyltransferase [Oscillospiraceae bacterium]